MLTYLLPFESFCDFLGDIYFAKSFCVNHDVKKLIINVQTSLKSERDQEFQTKKGKMARLKGKIERGSGI